jgi:LTXXQ motif family protein
LRALRSVFRGQLPQADDVPVLVDARLAGLKAGLNLTPQQEMLWPAVDTAMHEFGRLRFALIYGSTDELDQETPIEFQRKRSSLMEAAAHALTKLSDAESALYQTLDDTQKRRFEIIVRGMIAANMRACAR